MRLLFLTPQLPYPPYQGTTLRNLNIIKQLASRHHIHLLSFGSADELHDSPLREYCARIETVAPPTRSMVRRAFEMLVSPLPDMARRLYSPAFAAKLRAMLSQERYDVVQIEGIEMAAYWLQVKGFKLNAPLYQPSTFNLQRPTDAPPEPLSTFNLQLPMAVFDDHNAEWVLQRTAYETDRRNPRRWHAALYSGIQWRKLAQFERQVCLASEAVVVVSKPDARAIAALDPRIRPVVIPNGVDVEYYVPSQEVCAKPLAEWSLVFTGKFDFRPNIDAALWFADEILPELRKEIPLARISFVGQKPTPKVWALKERPGIEVTGFVPDTRPYIADAAVYVVPLRMGGGTRLKVLEAMAMGKAIVSTSFGVSGLECQDGREVLLADEPRAFARAVALLLRDRNKARELGANARRLVEEKYDWRKLAPRWEAIYAQGRG